jgi:hypothetical protein
MAHRTEDHSDMRLFKNRLWYLMEKKKFETAKDLATALCDNNLINVSRKKETEHTGTYSDEEIRKLNISAIERKVKSHMNLEDIAISKDLTPDYIFAYCKLFHCSSDFLFGVLDFPTYDEKFISNYTGLTVGAIETLSDFKNGYYPLLPYINMLLEKDEYFDDKLELLTLIFRYINPNTDIKSYDMDGVEKMENKRLILLNEYGDKVDTVSIDKLSSVTILSINELLAKFKNNLKVDFKPKEHDINDLLEKLLEDFELWQEIRDKKISETDDIVNKIRHIVNCQENIKRLKHLYKCNSIKDIDFISFKNRFPWYSDKIKFLKHELESYLD